MTKHVIPCLAFVFVSSPTISATDNHEHMMLRTRMTQPRTLELADWMVRDDDHNTTNHGTGGLTNTSSDTCPCLREMEKVVSVRILSYEPYGVDQITPNARDYEAYMGGKVKIESVTTTSLNELYEEIENDAKEGGSLFDAYYTNPIPMGTAVMNNGFLDLTPYLKENPRAEWTDVLLGLRKYVTSFEDKVYMVLLDGDTHSMFYRKDVLDAFGLQVPRTWNEYIEVAAAVHGKTFLNKTLSGSCVSRIGNDHAQFWAHLILSSITQTKGTHSGSLFDSKDMTPLAGAAMAEMIRIQEMQAKYGTPDEFLEGHNDVMNQNMNDGNCVLTFFWADLFRRSKAEGSILHDKLGIAPTPGSEWVLNRENGMLERCDGIKCPYAKYYEDIGWVNSAPYAAIGGWGIALSANTSPEKQRAMVDFAIWASSPEQSERYVIPKATLPISQINGQDPWRKEHLVVDKWVKMGYGRELSKQFSDTVLGTLLSKNVVIENRWPKAGEIMSIMDVEVANYLYEAHVYGMFPTEEDKAKERLRVADRVRDQWKHVISTYDQRADTVAPILEVYQRLRGVYVPNENRHLLTRFRPVGYTLFVVIVVSVIGSLAWLYHKRNKEVVRASQPLLLFLIGAGIVIMGSSIIPMGFDDGMADDTACSRACMSIPWLAAIGFTCAFAALFSKIWRLQRLVYHATRFHRVTITIADVLAPFAVTMGLNVAFLLTWTIADPLHWERVPTGRSSAGELTSAGRCTSSGTVSSVMIGLILAVNLAAISLACLKAFQTRNLKVAFNESAYIGLGVGSMLQAAAIGLPVLFLVQENPVSIYLVRVGLVFVICAALIGFIFVPKIILSNQVNDTRMRSAVASSSRFGIKSTPSSSALSKDFEKSRDFEDFPLTSSSNNDKERLSVSDKDRPDIVDIDAREPIGLHSIEEAQCEDPSSRQNEGVPTALEQTAVESTS